MTSILDSFSLQGRTALVIGGSNGIGRQIALGLQSAGARTAIVGRTQSRVDATLQLLRPADPRALGLCADVADVAQLPQVFEQVRGAIGEIDILVNSQGVTNIKPALDYTPADYAQLTATNLTSVFFACTTIGRRMCERGSGTIINIASLAAYRGWPGSTVYAITKHGVLALTQSLASEWATRGVRVNAIAPGFVMTELTRDQMSPQRKERALARTPMGRFGELGELVGAAVYLASPAAKFVTGETIAVDGGYLAAGI